MAIPAAASTETLSGGTSTEAAMVDRAIRRIDDDSYTDIATNAPGASGASLTVATDATQRYSVGDTLDWYDNDSYEAALVTAVAATTLTIRRGHWQTTGFAHAANAVFRVNPRFISAEILEHVRDSVEQLWPDIYEVKSATYTDATDLWYALPADAEELLQVYQLAGSTPDDLTTNITRLSMPSFKHSAFATTKKAFRVERIDTSLTNFFAIYTAKCSATTLNATQLDIVVYEACASLLEAEAAHRIQRQQDGFTFDSTTKLQAFRRRASQLRDRESFRLLGFLPQRDEMVWSGRKHYSVF
jgi:hypothetical protein